MYNQAAVPPVFGYLADPLHPRGWGGGPRRFLPTSEEEHSRIHRLQAQHVSPVEKRPGRIEGMAGEARCMYPWQVISRLEISPSKPRLVKWLAS